MKELEAALRSVTALLDGMKRRWALVGGLAVSARAEPRFTRDVDLAVAVRDDADAEMLVHRLLADGYSIAAAVEQKHTARLATIRLRAPGKSGSKGVVVDLLFASSGIEDVIVDSAERIRALRGLSMPVARVGHLLAMKVLSHDPRRRPQDGLDITALLAEAKKEDLAEAKKALQLITARGFNRRRDLLSAWSRLVGKRGAARNASHR